MDEKELDLENWSVEGQEKTKAGLDDPKEKQDSEEKISIPLSPKADVDQKKADEKNDDQKNDDRKADPLPPGKPKKHWAWSLLIAVALVAAGFMIYYFGYHDWRSATCNSPAICRICGRTKGTSLEHHWLEATCTTPRACDRCGYQEAYAPGHQWVEATCTSPKTCLACGLTEGEKIDHQWESATCTNPQTCCVCGSFVVGSELGHSWQEATCQNPKTCIVCGQTEGNPLEHSWQEATCQNPKTCIVCEQTEGNPLEHSWQEATWAEPKTCMVCGTQEGKNQKETFKVTFSYCAYDKETLKFVHFVKNPQDPAELAEGEALSITPKVKNEGDIAIAADIKMLIDGQQTIHWKEFEYGPGSTWRLENKYKKPLTAGKHTYEILVNDESMVQGEFDLPYDLP